MADYISNTLELTHIPADVRTGCQVGYLGSRQLSLDCVCILYTVSAKGPSKAMDKAEFMSDSLCRGCSPLSPLRRLHHSR